MRRLAFSVDVSGGGGAFILFSANAISTKDDRIINDVVEESPVLEIVEKKTKNTESHEVLGLFA